MNDMEPRGERPNLRKRKRRRGAERSAIPAQLVLDANLEGDVGLLAEDLFDDLFPALTSRQGTFEHIDQPILAV